MARVTHATLQDIREELSRGGVIEAPISSEGEHVSGYCDLETELVCINPLPELALAVCHEMTHRHWPRWGEKRVDRESRRVLSSMNDRDVASLVASYRRTRRKRRAVRVLTVD
jgi:hypothetical protein